MQTQGHVSDISIQSCTSLAEIHECVQLQRAIWDDPDEDLIPSSLYTVANKIGGQVLLARDGEKAVGFAYALPGFHADLRYLHSHIVGVLPEYQNRGLGRQIKLKQRELAVEQNIPLLEWTFDPLAIRNAYFNIVRLGAAIRSFYPNLYGITASPLHGGLPTDRLVAEWWLSSARVSKALDGEPTAVSPDAIEIRVPAMIEEWKTSDHSRAASLQAELRMQFQQRFAEGYAVTGFKIEDRDGVYLLDRQQDLPAISP